MRHLKRSNAHHCYTPPQFRDYVQNLRSELFDSSRVDCIKTRKNLSFYAQTNLKSTTKTPQKSFGQSVKLRPPSNTGHTIGLKKSIFRKVYSYSWIANLGIFLVSCSIAFKIIVIVQVYFVFSRKILIPESNRHYCVYYYQFWSLTFWGSE